MGYWVLQKLPKLKFYVPCLFDQSYKAKAPTAWWMTNINTTAINLLMG